MEKKLRIVRAQGLLQLSAIFVDKEIIDTCFVTMYFIGWFKVRDLVLFIAPNKIDPII